MKLARVPSGNGRSAAHGLALLDRMRHRALVVRYEAVVLPEKPPRDAPAIVIEHRETSREADARLLNFLITSSPSVTYTAPGSSSRELQASPVWLVTAATTA
jgi:hypothetical protein